MLIRPVMLASLISGSQRWSLSELVVLKFVFFFQCFFFFFLFFYFISFFFTFDFFPTLLSFSLPVSICQTNLLSIYLFCLSNPLSPYLHVRLLTYLFIGPFNDLFMSIYLSLYPNHLLNCLSTFLPLSSYIFHFD